MCVIISTSSWREVGYEKKKTVVRRSSEKEVGPFACINAAIEESTVADRRHELRAQDEFVRDHLQPQGIRKKKKGEKTQKTLKKMS